MFRKGIVVEVVKKITTSATVLLRKRVRGISLCDMRRAFYSTCRFYNIRTPLNLNRNSTRAFTPISRNRLLLDFCNRTRAVSPFLRNGQVILHGRSIKALKLCLSEYLYSVPSLNAEPLVTMSMFSSFCAAKNSTVYSGYHISNSPHSHLTPPPPLNHIPIPQPDLLNHTRLDPLHLILYRFIRALSTIPMSSISLIVDFHYILACSGGDVA
jgi:hypothetical protein